MNKPSPDRQEWLDFAHSVDVIASSALANSDISEMPGRSRYRGGLRQFFASPRRKRAIGGTVAAMCLLILALPAIHMWPGNGYRQEPISASLPSGSDSRQFPDRIAPAINLQITLPKTSYQLGETLSYTLQTNQNCHATLYSIGADNQVELFDLAPVGASTAVPSLKANTPLQSTGQSGQAPAIVPPARGTYTIGALCSREALAALGASPQSLADAAKQGGASFLSYLSELTKRVERSQLDDSRATYAVN